MDNEWLHKEVKIFLNTDMRYYKGHIIKVFDKGFEVIDFKGKIILINDSSIKYMEEVK